MLLIPDFQQKHRLHLVPQEGFKRLKALTEGSFDHFNSRKFWLYDIDRDQADHPSGKKPTRVTPICPLFGMLLKTDKPKCVLDRQDMAYRLELNQ